MNFLKTLEPSLVMLFFALLGVYRLLLRNEKQKFGERALKVVFLVLLALALALLSNGRLWLLFLGMPLILVLERLFDQRKSFDNLFYGIPLGIGLMSWAYAIRQLFITLGPGWFRVFPALLLLLILIFIRPLLLPQKLAGPKGKLDAFINDEGIALFALASFAMVSGLLYVFLRPQEPDLAIDLWQGILQGMLLLLIVYMDRIFYRLVREKELLTAGALAASVQANLAETGVLYKGTSAVDLDPSLTEGFEERLGDVLPAFATYAGRYFKRRNEAGKIVTLTREAAREGDALRLSLFGTAKEPLTEEQMSEEKKELSDLQRLLQEHGALYYESQDGTRHQLTLELKR